MSSKAKASSKKRPHLPSRASERFVKELLSALQGDESFKAMYLKEEMLSKYLDPKVVSPIVRARAGVRKWMQAEHQNLATNKRIMHANALNPEFGWTDWETFVSHVRILIARVLGPVIHPTREGQVTNGASTRVSRSNTAALEKLRGECHVSASASDHFRDFWADAQIAVEGWQIQNSSHMFTVPKKSDIDRVACKEPEANMLLQRIVGVHIRKRLRRKTGINLQDQTRNQRLAREGSRTGRLATIDLSSASDTISRMLVITLLPTDWWSLLDDLRVQSTLIPENLLDADSMSPNLVEHELNMFSSMGNGFTFELESLIFWAVTTAIQNLSKPKLKRDIISVYGDDIICSSELVPRIERMFNFLGFTLNLKKTNFGPKNKFRESCGGHYYDGFDVTPFYIREEVRELPHLIHLLNEILEWDGRGWGFFTSEPLARFHQRWRKSVPRRYYGAVDTDETDALVTGDSPRDRYAPISRPINIDHLEQERYLLWHIDSERMEDRRTSATIRIKNTKNGRTAYSSSNQPHVIVGYRPRRHPLKGSGVRTTWTPDLIWS
jgi:hypothetical protein